MKHLSVKWLYALLIAALLLTPAALAEAAVETPAEEEIAVDAVDEIFEEAEGDFGDEEAVDPIVVNAASDAITVSEDALYAAGQYGSIDIYDAVVTLEPEVFTYTGSACEPTVTVKCGENVLIQDEDYTVLYENNVNAGTGYVTITGIGNYSGSVRKSFTINRAKYRLTATYIGETPTKVYDATTRYYGGFKDTDFKFYTEDGAEVSDVSFGAAEASFTASDAGSQTMTVRIAIDPVSKNFNMSSSMTRSPSTASSRPIRSTKSA